MSKLLLDLRIGSAYYLSTPQLILVGRGAHGQCLQRSRTPFTARGGEHTVRLLLNGDNTKPGQSAHTVDLSDRGVRISNAFHAFSGRRHSHRLLGGNGKSMPSRVVWVELTPAGEYLAGLEFQGIAEA